MFSLHTRLPFDVDRLLRFLAQRAIPGVEQVQAGCIRRSLRPGAVAAPGGWIEVSFTAGAPRLQMQVSDTLVAHGAQVIGAVRRWLDLDSAAHAVHAALQGVPGDAGLRLPGSLDAFELAVRAVLGQQVTVAGARTLASRLVQRFGSALATPWPEITLTFPAPHTLADAATEHIAELGIIRTRARAIVALAQAWPELSGLFAEPTAPGAPARQMAALCALPGIGPWTAQYIAMRALSWADAFPPNDVALLKAMTLHFGTRSQREADVLAEQWRPWRAYAVLRLWNSLEGLPRKPA